MIKNEVCRIETKKYLADHIVELSLSGELVREMNEPGQFVHLKVSSGHDLLLRRPISIASIDKIKQTFTIIFRFDGNGTKRLAEKEVGDFVDVLGPLGHGFPVAAAQKGSHALLIGGGIGVPPLYELSKRLTESGVTVTHVLGFSSKEVVFYEEKFSELGETFIATVDGSYGYKGFVTDVIQANEFVCETIYACGPTPMLKALHDRFPEQEVYLSLEERMGCGIGACFACVCRTSSDPASYDYKKVCSDGPVFKRGEVVL